MDLWSRSQSNRSEKVKLFFGQSKKLAELDLETTLSKEPKNVVNLVVGPKLHCDIRPASEIQLLPRGWYSRMPTATVY